MKNWFLFTYKIQLFYRFAFAFFLLFTRFMDLDIRVVEELSCFHTIDVC